MMGKVKFLAVIASDIRPDCKDPAVKRSFFELSNLLRQLQDPRLVDSKVNQFLLIISPLLLLTYFSLSLDVWVERIHFIEYAVLGLLISRAVNVRTLHGIISTCCLITLIGVVDEIIQWFLPNRVGDIRDVTMNSFGGLSGIWLGRFLYWEQHFLKRNS